jgi:hypothetical protein
VLVDGAPFPKKSELRASFGISGWITIESSGTEPAQDLPLQFVMQTEIIGNGGGPGVPDTFRISTNTPWLALAEWPDALPPKNADVDRVPYTFPFILAVNPPAAPVLTNVVTGCEYRTPVYRGTFDMSKVPLNAAFTIHYAVDVSAEAEGLEAYAEAFIGDPVKYGSGITTEYDGVGELFYLGATFLDDTNRVHVKYPSSPDYYYTLNSRIGIDGLLVPIAMELGHAGDGELISPTPQPRGTNVFYSVSKVAIDRPIDTDGDGIDDVYELKHPSFLSPLNPADALQDHDNDKVTNFAEYKRGTDPAVPDSAPTLLIGPYPGGYVLNIGAGRLLRAADLDNDGLVDLVTLGSTNGSTYSLQSTLAATNGTFLPPISSPVTSGGVNPDFWLAKLDSDAFVDALVLDGGSNRLRVYRGMGNGQFQPLANFDTHNSPIFAGIGDLNDDGQPDLVAVSNLGSSVVPFLSQPGGGWESGTEVLLKSFNRPYGAVIADVNKDGHGDLILGTEGSTILVLLGDGHGAFTKTNAWSAGFGARHVAVGDLNGDGKPDIVSANLTTSDVSVLLGNGDGTFGGAKEYPAGSFPSDVVIRDLNHDGKPDLIVSNLSSDFHNILLNAGDGTFVPQTPAFTVTENAHAVVFDWNGDQNEDIASVLGNSNVLITTGRGDGTFQSRTQITLTNGATLGVVQKVVPVEITGDPRPELLALNQRSNTVDILVFSPAATNYLVSHSLQLDGQVQSFVVKDFNHDDKLDIAVVSGQGAKPSDTNELTLFLGTGGGNFAPGGKIPLPQFPNDIIAGDFGGDTNVDLLVLSYANGSVIPLLGNGGGLFNLGTPAKLGDRVASAQLVAVGSDPGAQLVLSGFTSNKSFLKLLKLQANGGWQELQTLSNDPDIVDFAVQDMNGDGRPDLVLLQADQGISYSVQLFAGNTSGGFDTAQTLIPSPEPALHLQAADIDLDGLTDLVVGSWIYFGKPGGGFSDPLPFWLSATGARVLADLDDDQTPDALTWDPNAGTISILFGD